MTKTKKDGNDQLDLFRAVEGFLSPREVMRRTSLSRSTLVRLSRTGEFPRPYPLSLRRIGWVEGDVMAWLAQRGERK